MTALSPHTEKPEPRDTLKVLHIDDEPDIIDITAHFLGGFDPGIHVHPCTDPGNALEELEADHFDCVVSDYQMGDYDSIGLAKTIQERVDLPILMYTGRGSEEIAEAAFAAGFDDYIRKEASPSHFQVLGKRIRAAVEKHRAEIELRDSEERFRSLFESTHDGVLSSPARTGGMSRPIQRQPRYWDTTPPKSCWGSPRSRFTRTRRRGGSSTRIRTKPVTSRTMNTSSSGETDPLDTCQPT